LIGGEVSFYEKLEGATEWEARNLLLRRPTPRALTDIA
jgi:hypothetical protein